MLQYGNLVVSAGAILMMSMTAYGQWSLNGVEVFYNTGNVGVGTNNPAHKLDVRSAGSRAVFGWAMAASGTADGVYGLSNSTTGRGVVGYNNADTGFNYGVYGRADSTKGRGVYGYAASSSGATIGVYGRTNSPNGYAGYFAGGKTFFEENVGVRTTSPNATLHAAGGVRALGGQNGPNGQWDAGYTFDGNGGDNDSGMFGPFDGHIDFLTNGTFAARIDSQQRLGLKVSPGHLLHLGSNDAAKPTSNTWTIDSDRRLKTNINSIEDSLDRLLQLRGVTYQWKDPASQGGMAGTYTGMIAQEVEPVFPEWVRTDANGYLTLTVIGFEGLVVEALRDLRQEKDAEIQALRDEKSLQINSLRATCAAQSLEIKAMNDRMARLEAQLSQIDHRTDRMPAVGKPVGP